MDKWNDLVTFDKRFKSVNEALAWYQSNHAELLLACKGALAALTQNRTYPADINTARAMLTHAIEKAEGKD